MAHRRTVAVTRINHALQIPWESWRKAVVVIHENAGHFRHFGEGNDCVKPLPGFEGYASPEYLARWAVAEAVPDRAASSARPLISRPRLPTVWKAGCLLRE